MKCLFPRVVSLFLLFNPVHCSADANFISYKLVWALFYVSSRDLRSALSLFQFNAIIFRVPYKKCKTEHLITFRLFFFSARLSWTVCMSWTVVTGQLIFLQMKFSVAEHTFISCFKTAISNILVFRKITNKKKSSEIILSNAITNKV